jgi:hypothetical protein
MKDNIREEENVNGDGKIIKRKNFKAFACSSIVETCHQHLQVITCQY